MSEENHWDLTNEYEDILSKGINAGIDQLTGFFVTNLPWIWAEIYREQSKREADICMIRLNEFEYIFDDFSSPNEEEEIFSTNPVIESRLVVAYGKSIPSPRKRDDYRLRNWIGMTGKIWGNTWDKGHFIAHSLGGSVDGTEINVFVQRRDLNRGWSKAGRKYREMEEYCRMNPGTFFFNRPIYLDQSSRPSYIEFGILKSNNELWIEWFDNR